MRHKHNGLQVADSSMSNQYRFDCMRIVSQFQLIDKESTEIRTSNTIDAEWHDNHFVNENKN